MRLIGFIWIIVFLPSYSFYTEASEKTVSVATLYGYPPYTFLKKGHKRGSTEMISIGEDSEVLKGMSWDLLREAFHNQGYRIKLNVSLWARALSDVKKGHIELLFPAGKNSEREAYFSYSKYPVNEATFLVYVLADSKIEWKGLSSMKGKTIGVVRGFNLGDNWNQQKSALSVFDVRDVKSGFKMLERKYIEGFAGYETNFDMVVKQNDWEGKFKKLPSFGGSAEYVVGLTKFEKTSVLLQAFDQGIVQIKESGLYQEILEKWQSYSPQK